MSKEAALGFNVYLITDGLLIDKSDIGVFFNKIEAALKGGVRCVQLREKGLCGAKLLKAAKGLRELCSRYEARLFINDRVDVALLSGADGVHLGTLSIKAGEVRAYLQESGSEALLIGVSTHNMEEAKEADRAGANFITFGPVFRTLSKAAYGAPVGLERLTEVTKRVDIPVFAIGGIDAVSIAEVKAHGAVGAAMISAILATEDIEKSASLIVREAGSKEAAL